LSALEISLQDDAGGFALMVSTLAIGHPCDEDLSPGTLGNRKMGA
jgi:hypothetical protein